MPTETMIEEPVLGLRTTGLIALLLVVVGGGAFYFAADSGDFPGVVAVAPLVPITMALIGALAGAGLGLLLADVRKTTTTKEAPAGLAGDLPAEAFKVLKDLTPGKTLLVLAVALFSVLLVVVDPPPPSAAGQQSAPAG